jgi:hypothetical protein
MAASLSDCSVLELFFLGWSEGVKQFEIYMRNLAQYGGTAYGTENCIRMGGQD